MSRKALSAVVALAACILFAGGASAAKREELSASCRRRCARVKNAHDGWKSGFRYKHSDIGGGVVALTNEYSSRAVFLEANECRTVETTRYWGVANGGRHHYYTARGKAGAQSPQELAKKARRKGRTSRGFFMVGNTCYGPFNLGQEQD